MISIGEAIKKERKFLDMTQAQLAEKLGISVVTLRKYEKDEATPSARMLHKIAKALDLSITEFSSLVVGKNYKIEEDQADFLSYRIYEASSKFGDTIAQDLLDTIKSQNNPELTSDETLPVSSLEDSQLLNFVCECYNLFRYSLKSVPENGDKKTAFIFATSDNSEVVTLTYDELITVGKEMKRYFRFLMDERDITLINC